MHRPSAIWYLIGVLVIIGGLVASIAGALHEMSGLESAFVRFVMPGATDLHINKPGPYVVYYEYKSVIDGEIFSSADSTDIQCSITGKSGEAVTIEPSALSAEYEFAGRAGKSIAQFTAPRAGAYLMTCSYPKGSGPRIAVAVAPSGMDLVAALFKWLAVAFICLAAGMVILIVTVIRRAGPARPAP